MKLSVMLMRCEGRVVPKWQYNSQRVHFGTLDLRDLYSHLIDTLVTRLNLKNYAALARTLGVPQAVVSKMLHGQLEVGATMLINMHEESGLSIKELRALMGVTKESTAPDLAYHRGAELPNHHG